MENSARDSFRMALPERLSVSRQGSPAERKPAHEWGAAVGATENKHKVMLKNNNKDSEIDFTYYIDYID